TAMAQMESLVKGLDSSGGGADQVQVRTVFLKHARAENVSPLVSQLLAGEEIPLSIRIAAARGNRTLPSTGPQVRVAADTRLNAVVISAPGATLNIAEQMVSQLDIDPATAGGAGARSVRVLSIENADASQLAQNLDAMFSGPEQTEAKPVIR